MLSGEALTPKRGHHGGVTDHEDLGAMGRAPCGMFTSHRHCAMTAHHVTFSAVLPSLESHLRTTQTHTGRLH